MELSDSLQQHFRLALPQQRALKKLGIETIESLLFHIPFRYDNYANLRHVQGLQLNQDVVLYGTISKLKTRKAWRSKRPIAEGIFEDGTGKIKIIWFNQPYLAKYFSDGDQVKVSGKVSGTNDVPYLANPEMERATISDTGLFEKTRSQKPEAQSLFPVYPESRGVTSLWMYHALQQVFEGGILEKIIDPVPQEILAAYNLPSLKSALIWVHRPRSEKDSISARKRFAFNEVFYIQLAKQQERAENNERHSLQVTVDEARLETFIKRFPFEATKAQRKAIADILTDFRKEHPMSRLLEGDVGSGKTAVAAATVYSVTTSRPPNQNFGALQSAYMVPTEILAAQHFESFIQYFKHLPIAIGLITSSGCKKFPSKVNSGKATDISRTQLLKWVKNGEIPILIGTHALIQKSVEFKNLAYVIIDEQHRFGTSQRMALARGKARNERGVNAEQQADTLLYRDLTYTIRNILFEIKKTIGLGHKESVYQNAFEEELLHRRIAFSKERQIPITYRDKKIGVYQPDFVIDEKIIVEFKSIPFIGQKEKKQLWTYLKGSEYRLALLVNFGSSELDIKRVVYDQARMHASASSPHGSASMPHLLSMTATPIPRTLALTVYGDLDLSLLDEMPKGRKPVITDIVLPKDREKTYEHIRRELKAGRQAYVICPRIDEPDPQKELALNAKSVKEEAKRLKKEIFPEYEISILHSKMTPKEKDTVMKEFVAGTTHIMVATSVVEVGVNVPNATIIIIEGAERFGLAQLHQLRGRVLRSTDQAYCYIFSESKSKQSQDRLKALKTAQNGFELAELDLNLRGAGELYGRRQWGLSDVGMEAIRNIKMVEAARSEAHKMIAADPHLVKHPLLKEIVHRKKDVLHFE